MGYNPQESLENTINTVGTRTLGVHPIVPWNTNEGNVPWNNSSGTLLGVKDRGFII